MVQVNGQIMNFPGFKQQWVKTVPLGAFQPEFSF
jgi:hypothetical protein